MPAATLCNLSEMPDNIYREDATGDLVLVRRGVIVGRWTAAGMPCTGDLGLVQSSGNLVATAKHAAKWPFRIPSASGKDTDAKKGGIAGCDQALDITATEAAATYCKVFDNSATTKYANLETASAADFIQWQLFPNNTQDADAVHFGKSTPFCELWLDLSATVQTYTGDGTTWKYWNGTSWAALTIAHDYTDATAQDGKRSFGRDGAISFVPPADWALKTIDGVSAYWIQCCPTAANISQVGITNSKRHYYCAPTDGFKAPHAGVITDIAIRDEAGTVHTATDVKLALVNFTTGAHSGEITFPQDKRNDGWASLTLAVAAGDVLGVLVSQEDGTNEIGPFSLELGVTLA